MRGSYESQAESRAYGLHCVADSVKHTAKTYSEECSALVREACWMQSYRTHTHSLTHSLTHRTAERSISLCGNRYWKKHFFSARYVPARYVLAAGPPLLSYFQCSGIGVLAMLFAELATALALSSLCVLCVCVSRKQIFCWSWSFFSLLSIHTKKHKRTSERMKNFSVFIFSFAKIYLSSKWISSHSKALDFRVQCIAQTEFDFKKSFTIYSRVCLHVSALLVARGCPSSLNSLITAGLFSL